MISKSPSKLNRLRNCTGSGALSEGIKAPVYPATLLGTRAHKAVLGSVKYGHEGVAVEPGDEAHRKAWEGHVDKLLLAIMEAREFEVEVYLPALTDLGMTLEDREGEHQADLVWIDKDGALHVLDYKHGLSPVDVKHNDQLLAYAWAWSQEHGVVRTTFLHIYQPYVNPEIQTWAVQLSLVVWGEETQRIMKEVDAGGELKEGDWCKWCPALSKCPLKIQAKQDRQDKKESTVAAGLQVLSTSPAFELGKAETLKVQLEKFLEPAVERAQELQIEAAALDELTAETAQACSDILAQATTFEKQLKDSKAVVKAPILDLGKVVEAAFDVPNDLTAQAKTIAKQRLVEFETKKENERRRKEQERLAEQARLDEEARKAAEAAAKLKGKAKAEAEAKAQEAARKAAEASVVEQEPEEPKVAGVTKGKSWTAVIPQVGAVPEKYLIKHEGSLTVDKKTSYPIVEVDGALILRDAEKLQGKPWIQLSSTATVKAGR